MSGNLQCAPAIADTLNEILLPDYFADPHVHAGSRIEVDAGMFNDHPPNSGWVITLLWPQPIFLPT